MNSILRRSILPVFRPGPAASVCRRCYSTPATTAEEPGKVVPARTRFAPSPTGFMHLGSLRTALYNYLLAKSTGGEFILRIEDTDQKRTVEGAEENIYETLRWAGLQWDEGPEVGGKHGPYKQSKRTALHRAHAEQLLERGQAYRCFCGRNRLEALAAKRQVSGLPVEYDRHCYNLSMDMSNSRAARDPYVIRLLAPDEWPSFNDIVYGRILYGKNTRAHSEGSFEDPILLKSDGTPTYHLANVVDDHYMDVTHVIRGAEWMPSTPKHMHLYSCFEWSKPQWVHVGLLQGKDRTKLSKRSGDTMVSEYIKEGYTPDALNNFVALLGWSHGGNGKSDVMTLDEMVVLFDMDGLTAGNTIVNPEKLPFLQKSHLRRNLETSKESENEEVAKVEKEVRASFGNTLETGMPITTDYIRKILKANAKNYKIVREFAAKTDYFFRSPTFDSESFLRSIVNFRKVTGMSTSELYHGFIEEAEKIPDTPETWNASKLKDLLSYEQELDEEAWTLRMRLVRIALSGGISGPSIAVTMHLLGKSRTIARLRNSDAAFEGYKGELEAAEKKHAIAHDKLVNEYQTEQREEIMKEEREERRLRKEGLNKGTASIYERQKQGKGYQYMNKAMKARADEQYRQKVQDVGTKLYKPKFAAQDKVAGKGQGTRPPANGDDWN